MPIRRIVASTDLLVYVSQSSRGEVLVGAEIERCTTYSTRSTFSFLAECASRTVDLLPVHGEVTHLAPMDGDL